MSDARQRFIDWLHRWPVVPDALHQVEIADRADEYAREAYIRGAKDAIHELMRRVGVMPPTVYGVTGVQLRDLQDEIDRGAWPPSVGQSPQEGREG